MYKINVEVPFLKKILDPFIGHVFLANFQCDKIKKQNKNFLSLIFLACFHLFCIYPIIFD